jgi:beta-lactamase superfamily II metal-dependent hydrolase
VRPRPLTKGNLGAAGGFVQDIKDDDLVYFCLNVGDADAQVVVLPRSPDGVRRLMVVDAGVTGKVKALLEALETAGIVAFDNPADATIALVVATHPHFDHIAGIEEIFVAYGDHVGEFWEPGFFHTSAAYSRMLTEIAKHSDVVYSQPTSGLRRFFGPVAVTVLSPSIQLRNRFDTYGVEINDSSISLHLEHPARAVAAQAAIAEGQGNFAVDDTSAALVLGADAQTLSWSFVATDFPYLAASGTAQADAIGAATGRDLLSANVLKVSHHASKHGINLELVERIKPAVTIVSSTASGDKYGFPHDVSQQILREALDPVAGTVDAQGNTQPHRNDEELGIFYTCDTTNATGKPSAGSFGVITRGRRRRLWRFMDGEDANVNLAAGRRWS